MFGRNQILLTWGSHISEHSPTSCPHLHPSPNLGIFKYLPACPSFLPCTPSAVAVCLFLELFHSLIMKVWAFYFHLSLAQFSGFSDYSF